MRGWYETKLFLQHSLSISTDALHIMAGLLVWFAAALIMRVPLASWRPWLLLMAALLMNEAGDLWIESWPTPAMQYGEAAKDVLLTMIIPTMVMLAARIAPWLFASRPPTR